MKSIELKHQTTFIASFRGHSIRKKNCCALWLGFPVLSSFVTGGAMISSNQLRCSLYLLLTEEGTPITSSKIIWLKLAVVVLAVTFFGYAQTVLVDSRDTRRQIFVFLVRYPWMSSSSKYQVLLWVWWWALRTVLYVAIRPTGALVGIIMSCQINQKSHNIGGDFVYW